MSFAKEIGLIDELEKKFSHLKKRKRGDAENVIKEEKEGFAVGNILAEDFLANAAFFQ